MSKEKALMIAQEFLENRNPGGWNGQGEKPFDFDTKLFFFESRKFPFLNYSLSYEWEPHKEDPQKHSWICVCRCWRASFGRKQKSSRCHLLDSKEAICDLIISVS